MTTLHVGSVAILALLSFTMFLGLAVRPAAAVTCSGPSYCGTVYVSTEGSGINYASFYYDPTSRTLTWDGLASSGGTILDSGLQGGQSDGLTFDSVTGNLIVGVNCNGPDSVVEVSPTTGSVLATIATGGVQPSHLMADKQGNVWSSSDGCPTETPAIQIQLSSTPSTDTVTTHTISGSTDYVNSLIFTGSTTMAFYTSSACCGGFGQFGTIDLSTFVTTCVQVSGVCSDFTAAHGGTYDPYSNAIIIFGDNSMTQFTNANLPVKISSLSYSGAGILDQGTVDGQGHLFVSGGGGVLFLDYRTSGLVGTEGNFIATTLCNSVCTGGHYADDVAPLVGPGSPIGVPEFPSGFFVAIAVAIPLLIVVKTRFSGNLGADRAA